MFSLGFTAVSMADLQLHDPTHDLFQALAGKLRAPIFLLWFNKLQHIPFLSLCLTVFGIEASRFTTDLLPMLLDALFCL